MAKNKTIEVATPAEETQTPVAETESSQVENMPEVGAEQAQAEKEEVPAQGETPPAPPETTEPLFSLEEMEMKHRVPGWQHSALKRLMGWASGKMVTGAEYEAALDQLNNRRVGGGRR